MLEFQKTLKRMMLDLLICVPFFMIISFLLSYFFNVPLWLNIFVNVIIGIILCFVIEIIFAKIRKKKEQLPKKKDPFAD